MACFSWTQLCSFYSSETLTAVACREGHRIPRQPSHSQHLDPSHEWVQSSEPQNDSVAADYGQMHEPKICWKWIFGPQFSWSACEQVCRVWPNQKSVCQEHRTSTFGLKLEWIPFLFPDYMLYFVRLVHGKSGQTFEWSQPDSLLECSLRVWWCHRGYLLLGMVEFETPGCATVEKLNLSPPNGLNLTNHIWTQGNTKWTGYSGIWSG